MQARGSLAYMAPGATSSIIPRHHALTVVNCTAVELISYLHGCLELKLKLPLHCRRGVRLQTAHSGTSGRRVPTQMCFNSDSPP